MEYSIRSKSNAIKIELNDRGDYIARHPGNAKMFDNFARGYDKIMKLADEMPKRINLINQDQSGQEEKEQNEINEKVTAEYVSFSEQFIEIIDSIFGAGTIHKYFIHLYEEVHDFVPDVACAEDFFEQITPAIEQIFDKHLKKRKAAMAKYQPQDHKRSQK